MDRIVEDGLQKLVQALHVAFQPDHERVVNALRDLATFNPGDTPIQFDPKSGCSVYGKTSRKDIVEELQRDARAPFFSESYLYNLIGKEDGRSVLARFRALCMALGVDEDEIYRAVPDEN